MIFPLILSSILILFFPSFYLGWSKRANDRERKKSDAYTEILNITRCQKACQTVYYWHYFHTFERKEVNFLHILFRKFHHFSENNETIVLDIAAIIYVKNRFDFFVFKFLTTETSITKFSISFFTLRS